MNELEAELTREVELELSWEAKLELKSVMQELWKLLEEQMQS